MKAFRFLLVAISLLCVIPCFGKRVRLNGNWDRKQKSIGIDIPITATVDENMKELSLQFNRNIGLVYVTIYNSLGEVVYYEVLDAIEFSSYTIQLDKKLQGEYVISISDNMNNVYGLFEF